MSIKNLAKTIAKFAAIVLGVFILSQAVSAKSYSFNLSYSGGNYPSYGLVGYSYSDRDYYAPPIISYDYYRPPLYYYGTYYSDSIGGYPFGGYYNTYSPYYPSSYGSMGGYPFGGYYNTYSPYYPSSYSGYGAYNTYPGYVLYG